jgi:hypothetical protein
MSTGKAQLAAEESIVAQFELLRRIGLMKHEIFEILEDHEHDLGERVRSGEIKKWDIDPETGA